MVCMHACIRVILCFYTWYDHVPGFALGSNGVEFLIISGAKAQEASLYVLTVSLTT